MAPIDARNKLEQIRRKKNKNKPGQNKPAQKNKVGSSTNVKDLRQLIAKKKKTTTNKDRSPNRVAGGRVTKSSRDLRETNRKLAARRNLSQTRDNRLTNKPDRSSQGTSTRRLISNNTTNKRSTTNGNSRLFKTGKQIQQQYYVPPHLQHQQPTYAIIAPAPQSNLAMDNVPEAQGASVLISNLMPSITQSEIIELFGDIGVMTAVNMINQTTALVTYQNSSDAVRAVKVYHNRLLDGKPMLVNMMPNSTPASNVRSRVGNASIIGSHPAPMELSYASRRI